MSYEIVGETIKSAIAIKLGELFNPVYDYKETIYKETITNPKYPNLYIVQVNLSQRPNGLQGGRVLAKESLVKRMQLDYLCNVQYRYVEDIQRVSNIQQKLDEAGLKLLTEFNTVDLELPVKVYNKSYEKVDGVGQFTFNITIFAKSEDELNESMKKLQVRYKDVKNG